MSDYTNMRESDIRIAEQDLGLAERLLDGLGLVGEPDAEAVERCGSTFRARLDAIGFETCSRSDGGISVRSWNDGVYPVPWNDVDAAEETLRGIAPTVVPGCMCVWAVDGGREGESWLYEFDGAGVDIETYDNSEAVRELARMKGAELAYSQYFESRVREHPELAQLVLTPSQFALACNEDPVLERVASRGQGIGEAARAEFEEEFAERRLAAIESRLHRRSDVKRGI